MLNKKTLKKTLEDRKVFLTLGFPYNIICRLKAIPFKITVTHFKDLKTDSETSFGIKREQEQPKQLDRKENNGSITIYGFKFYDRNKIAKPQSISNEIGTLKSKIKYKIWKHIHAFVIT